MIQGRPGEKNHRAKMTDALVIEARRLFDEMQPRYGLTKKITRIFDRVNDRAMSCILTGLTWRHLIADDDRTRTDHF